MIPEAFLARMKNMPGLDFEAFCAALEQPAVRALRVNTLMSKADAVCALLPFDTTGIEFSMTALFVTVFVEQWLTTKNHWPALVGLACSVLCLVLFGADNFLIPTMIAITLALLFMRKGEKNCA